MRQGTFGQTNINNNSDSNSSIDGDDAMFYSQYVHRELNNLKLTIETLTVLINLSRIMQLICQ